MVANVWDGEEVGLRMEVCPRTCMQVKERVKAGHYAGLQVYELFASALDFCKGTTRTGAGQPTHGPGLHKLCTPEVPTPTCGCSCSLCSSPRQLLGEATLEDTFQAMADACRVQTGEHTTSVCQRLEASCCEQDCTIDMPAK